MTEPTLPEHWIPGDRFRAEALKFAEYRTTERYRTDEIEYKQGLAALLRHITSKDALIAGPSGIEALAAGHPDLPADELTASDLELLRKWPAFQALLNLLGGGQAAVIQASTLRRWAALEPAEVASSVEQLLRGPEPLADRLDLFLRRAQEAYGRLFAGGQLKAKEVPRVAPQLAAVLLCLTSPDRYGLYRPSIYQAAADWFEYPLTLAGSTGARYATLTAMLAAFRDALRAEGCPVENILEVHNLLWIRAKEPGWSGLGGDRWALGDFEAMRVDQPQDPTLINIIDGKLRRVGDGLRGELRAATGRDFRTSILGRYPPSRRSWSWLNVSLGEQRYGTQPTARPQLNVEIGQDGIDVFYSLDLRPSGGPAAPVRARVRERRGDPALLGPAGDVGYAETPAGNDDRYMVRRRIPRETVIAWPGLGIDELAAELNILLPIYEAMAAEADASPTPRKDQSVDPLFVELASALEDRGQAILYGPPGTGKTWNAHRFAMWWLTTRWGGDAGSVLTDPAHARAADARFTKAQRERRAWWVVANPAEWSWDRLFKDGTVEYRYGRVKANYDLLQEGDLVIGYQANPDKRVMALAKVSRTLHSTPEGQQITLEPVAKVTDGLTYEEMLKDPILAISEPARLRNQGTLFRLSGVEADIVLATLADRNPGLPNLEAFDPAEGMGALTRVTFHPSYGYEDFVEGYRPVPTTTGQLNLALTPGVFKRVCQAARADPTGRPFILLIDEINRGNIAKIFGELITLIEKDKRNDGVVLPQSGDPFSVPSNVYLLGTMNTADRSIRLLDAALRRRFAFIELLPDARPMGDAMVGDLPLGRFLDELNLRIIKRHGREKQVGQSFLLDDGRPVGSAKLFAARFRREILPLLQEYAYDDFRELTEYLGPDLVDAERQRVVAVDRSPDELVASLAVEYGMRETEAEEVG
ncbi:MAG TPA: AAA family ATPase [Propionicimonas sp.]